MEIEVRIQSEGNMVVKLTDNNDNYHEFSVDEEIKISYPDKKAQRKYGLNVIVEAEEY